MYDVVDALLCYTCTGCSPALGRCLGETQKGCRSITEKYRIHLTHYNKESSLRRQKAAHVVRGKAAIWIVQYKDPVRVAIEDDEL